MRLLSPITLLAALSCVGADKPDSKPPPTQQTAGYNGPARFQPVYNSTYTYDATGDRKIGVSRAPDRLFISSIVGNGTTAVSFSTKGYVRFGVEWHRDMTALTGARIPDISFAARAIGLFEVNSTYPDIKNNYGKKYRLDEGSFHWTPIVIQDPKPIDNTTGRIFIASTTGTSNDGLYPPSNGIKFDFDVKSPPTYNMVPATASSWNLVLGFFSSSGNATLTTGNSLSDVAQRFDWPTWLMADGTNQTMSIVGGLNGTYPDGGFSPSFSSSKAQVNGSLYSDRQDDLDARCSQRAISFAILTLPLI
ncbi:hypothetical protein BSLG_001726 [Batrachochytrium salamandrivorans]|nr:hypothetical protein BSLG_001726 [Batrachochytrium salamandrivorans]